MFEFAYALYLPGAHLVHWLSAVMNEPAPHSISAASQYDMPDLAWYLEPGHERQSATDSRAELGPYVPDGQLSQPVLPVLSWNLPIGQAKHALSPESVYAL